MAATLFISNSDPAAEATAVGAPPPSCAIPWAFIWALAILLAIELAVRFADPRRMIPWKKGLEEHFAIAAYLEQLDKPDVCFLGSSVSRYGIDRPLVEQIVRTRLGKRIIIYNHSASGAMADEIYSIVRHMIRNNAAPRLLLIETHPRQFDPNTASRFVKNAAFWTVSDWREACDRYGPQADAVFHDVIRNRIADRYYTFRYRTKFQYAFQNVWTWNKDPQVPPNFDIDGFNARQHDRSKSIHRASKRGDSRFHRGLIRVEYDKFSLSPLLMEDLERAIVLCKTSGINVVLYEAPLSDLMRQVIPADVYPRFYSFLDRLSHDHNVPVIRLSDVRLDFNDAHFIDSTHLNTLGAERFSKGLAERVVLPQLFKLGLKTKRPPRRATQFAATTKPAARAATSPSAQSANPPVASAARRKGAPAAAQQPSRPRRPRQNRRVSVSPTTFDSVRSAA